MKTRTETLPELITAVITERTELIEALLSLLKPHDKRSDDDLAHHFDLDFDVIKKARNVAEKYRDD